MSNPFGSVGKRFKKYAEKQIQKGINYLEIQANSANADNAAYSHNSYNTSSTNHTSTSPQSQYPPSANFTNGPPPPTPFSEPFPQPQNSQNNTSTSSAIQTQTNHTPSTKLYNASSPIITQDLLLQMQTRVPSACTSLGSTTVTEARKGLSRVLTSTHEDIELFGTQLKNTDFEAVNSDWNTLDDELPCFALSYVQHEPQGRFKFSDEQWQNFHRAVKVIAHAGITRFRVWLDQCLWIRDASQASWAHTGIVPYALWPVIALGSKLPGGERTIDSFKRMWPFVEQVCALWGMGLIVTSEYRTQDTNSGVREWFSYNLRVRTEPEACLAIILLNVFHGATDALKTGWVDDVNELKEMANANVMYESQVIIGSDWKDRFAAIGPRTCDEALSSIQTPIRAKYLGGVNIYLDDSRTLQCNGWDGIREWFSGNEGHSQSREHDLEMINIGMKKYNVITDVAEYQLLHKGSVTTALWLCVAMNGRSSYFSRGRVAWTKILTGKRSCSLTEMVENGDVLGIQRALREQLNNDRLRIRSINEVDGNIEWI